MPAIADIDVIAPNFKRRLSGVTTTIIQLVPLQYGRGLNIAALGPGLPANVPQIAWKSLLGLWRRPASGRPFRVWHARRNIEMVAGVLLRYVLRAPMRLVFTSDAQRHHRPFTKWLIRRMDRIVTSSARSGSFLEVPHQVIMHGVNTDLFHPPTGENEADARARHRIETEYAVGCFGRIREQKGTDLFVDALIELLPNYPDWTAVVTGRVTVEHRAFADGLQKRVASAGLENRIRFLGEVSDIKPWYRLISLFVAPSRNEGYGLTPLEAMASQTPVVASDAGAYAEMIVEGITGTIVPAGDGAALTNAIERYLADPELARRHGLAARSHVTEQFALDREAGELTAVYESLWTEYENKQR